MTELYAYTYDDWGRPKTVVLRTAYLGNNRLVTDASGMILQTNHYDPYGDSLPDGAAVDSGNPYKYSGKEYDDKALAYDFGARHYTSSIPRWTTMDPLAEKNYSISPYAYCAGNPVNLVDPEGMYFLDEQDEKEARELERQLKRKAYRYARKANRLKGKPSAKYDEYSQRANELFLSMRDIRDMRDNEKMAFHFEEYKSESQQQNELETPETQITDTDTKGNPIVVMFSERGNGNTIHEVKHGGQYARGEMERIEEVEREIQAYRAQWAWKGVLSYMSECNLRQSRLVWDFYKEKGYAIFDKSLLRTIYKVNDINSAMVNDIIAINKDKEFWGLYPERIIR